MPIFDEICKRSLKFLQTCLFHNTSLIRSVALFSLTEGRNSSPCGRNALFRIRRYQCALSDIVCSISNISVAAVVVSSDISGAQRRESEFLRELLSIRDRVLYLPSVFLSEWHCGTYLLCYCFLAFLFLSFYCDSIFSVGLLFWACAWISCSLHLLLFLLSVSCVRFHKISK